MSAKRGEGFERGVAEEEDNPRAALSDQSLVIREPILARDAFVDLSFEFVVGGTLPANVGQGERVAGKVGAAQGAGEDGTSLGFRMKDYTILGFMAASSLGTNKNST